MKEILATITSKGRMTIPSEVRKHLGLKANDKIAFVVEPDGSVRLKAPRYPTVESLRGSAGDLKRPLAWKEISRIAREERIMEKYGRQG